MSFTSGILLAYCGLATLITVFNKYILITYIPDGYTCNLYILLVQSSMSVAMMYLCSKFGVITYRPFDAKYLPSWIPIIVLLILSVYSNGKSVELLPISTFNVLKNIGLLLTISGDVVFFKKELHKNTYIAVSIVLVTSILHHAYKSQDTSYSLRGVAWAIINCAACSLYGLYVKYHRTCYHGITSIEYVYYNNSLTIPVIAALSFYFEEYHSRGYLPCAYVTLNASTILFFLLSSVLTLLITIVIANIHTHISSTTYAVVASLNKLPMSIISMLIFQDDIATWSNVAFVCLSIVTSIVFVSSV